MPSSIVRVVRTDHERLPRLLRRVVTSGPSQDRWRAELLQLLHAHRAAERAVLTPEVLAPAGPAATQAVAELAGLDEQLEEAARALEGADLGSPSLPGLGDRLVDLVVRHAALTDAVLVPLETAVARKQVRLLGGAYEQARENALHAEGASEPPPRRLDLPRAELYELAKKAGIEGRSAMSRGELIAELQQRQDG